MRRETRTAAEELAPHNGIRRQTASTHRSIQPEGLYLAVIISGPASPAALLESRPTR
jgi:hypothetical protein